MYSFTIDEKSLFVGIKNDFSKGQSATVHTPLNQSSDKNNWRNDIYNFLDGNISYNISQLPDTLRDKCLKQTTSKAKSKIIYFYVFSRFSLDGKPFMVNSSFAMYVKEEIDKEITNREGKKEKNTHYGRHKLHYRKELIHKTDGFNIDNKKVLNTILEVNGGFAYIVNGFDIDTKTQTLNFNTTMVGLQGVLLSNVFKRQKGVGVKLLVDGIGLDRPSTPLQSNIFTDLENDAFFDTLEKIQYSSRSNGEKGEEYVYNNLSSIIKITPENISHTSILYPQSPYDIEYIYNGEKFYIEVKATASNKKSFYLSRGEKRFMDKYENNYMLILITNVNSSQRRHHIFYRKDIMNERIMRQEYQSVKYTAI